MNLIRLSLILAIVPLFVRAQDDFIPAVKGGNSFGLKGGSGGFSRFKESITSIQRQQQQTIPQQQVNFKSVSTSSNVLQQVPVVVQQPTIISNSRVEEQSSVVNAQQQETLTSDSEPAIYGSVQGTPGIDFPDYKTIPNTKFSCDNVPYDPGMYADESTGCQVYHLCYQGRKESFLCGIGTVFNQAIMNCDFWSSVECSKSSQYYKLNSDFGKASAEGGSSSLQGVSNSFVSRQSSVVIPSPVISSQTDFVSKKESFATVQRPVINNFKRIESSSQVLSSIGGKVSSPKQTSFSSSFQANQNFGTKGGASVASNQRFFSTALATANNNFNQQQADNEPQFASGSSINMAASKTSAPMTSQDLSSAQKSKSWSKSNKQNSFFGSKNSNEIEKASTEATGPPSSGLSGAGGEQSEWKPYFKSSSSTIGITPATPPEPSTMQTMLLPDQEPKFSSNEVPSVPTTTTTTEKPSSDDGDIEIMTSNKPKSEAPPSSESPIEFESRSSTTEPPNEEPSVESDVGSALTTTMAAAPATTSAPESNEGANNSEEPPTSTTASSSTNSSGEGSTESAATSSPATAASSLSSDAESSSSPAPTPSPTPATTSSSSVEYAADSSSSTTKSGKEEESPEEAETTTTTARPQSSESNGGKKKKRKRQSRTNGSGSQSGSSRRI